VKIAVVQDLGDDGELSWWEERVAESAARQGVPTG